MSGWWPVAVLVGLGVAGVVLALVARERENERPCG